MGRVWKYRLVPGENTVTMPQGAHALSVGVQGDDPGDPRVGHHLARVVLWALVDPSAPVGPRVFFVATTGFDDVDPNHVFVGTVQRSDGLVFHVFDTGAAAAFAYRMAAGR